MYSIYFHIKIINVKGNDILSNNIVSDHDTCVKKHHDGTSINMNFL